MNYFGHEKVKLRYSVCVELADPGIQVVRLIIMYSQIIQSNTSLLNFWWSHTVQLMSRLTLTCEDIHVFLYFCRVTQSELTCDTRVNFRVENASYISCTARDPSSYAARL